MSDDDAMEQLFERLRVVGRPLRDVAGVPQAGITPPPGFVLDKATRDQLAIFDPSCAPLIRRYVLAEDIEPWYVVGPRHYLLAIPRGWSQAQFGADCSAAEAWEQLKKRYPSIAKHLTAHAPAQHEAFWWELDLPPLTATRFAWPAAEQPEGFAALPTASVPGTGVLWLAGEPELFGVLSSRLLRWLLARDIPLIDLPILTGTQAERLMISALVHDLGLEAQARAAVIETVCRRLLADFGPPGRGLSPALRRWWQLDFAGLRAELRASLQNDIPFHYQASWEQYLEQNRAELQQHDAAIVANQQEIDRLVAGIYGLQEHELTALSK